MNYSKDITELFQAVGTTVAKMNYEFVTPELFLFELCKTKKFRKVLAWSDANHSLLCEGLREYLEQQDSVERDENSPISFSMQMQEAFEYAIMQAESAGRNEMGVPHAINAILHLPESQAAWLLMQAIHEDIAGLLRSLTDVYEREADSNNPILSPLYAGSGKMDSEGETPEDEEPGTEGINPEEEDEELDFTEYFGPNSIRETTPGNWKDLVVCLNDIAERRNPLVGREEELERTIQVLCRKEKNNPLHVGEPGVGKTALVYGLARRINEGNVPERLKDFRIYSLELGQLLAGTQYRGDFEKRIKMIMDGVESEGQAILYIDEIHNLVGAGQVGESSMDASNMLKPYLEKGEIRFIGSTTFEEYKRYFARSKGLVRRFQQIDIQEPSIDEAINILRQLMPGYEAFHGVAYTPEAVEFAVRGSARHLHDRFLPDKAIDLIDEAGAYRQIHPDGNEAIVDRRLIADVLARMCKVESLAEDPDDTTNLEKLDSRISAEIYGQDAAIRAVTEAVMMAKAGLTDETRPLASLLFVGPTGVGKTEVAKVLARELGVELVRFDMSEFAEKHSVAKLVGAPAGYVGYDDGGLLTDAVRKTPSCVLLLDEIEKAHPDIFNILLQVMDYGRLTDSKGNQVDFRNVILIMTSNAGAQYASQASVGFASRVSAGDAMLRQVKKTFKPEFLNRLSDTIVFNDMTREMAALVLEKRLRDLRQRLAAKNVTFDLSAEAREWLIDKGFTKEYGARQLDRILHTYLKTPLMRQLLFGPLKSGGYAAIALSSDRTALDITGNKG